MFVYGKIITYDDNKDSIPRDRLLTQRGKKLRTGNAQLILDEL